MSLHQYFFLTKTRKTSLWWYDFSSRNKICKKNFFDTKQLLKQNSVLKNFESLSSFLKKGLQKRIQRLYYYSNEIFLNFFSVKSHNNNFWIVYFQPRGRWMTTTTSILPLFSSGSSSHNSCGGGNKRIQPNTPTAGILLNSPSFLFCKTRRPFFFRPPASASKSEVGRRGIHSFGFLLRDRLLKTVVAWASAAKRQLRLVILLRVQAVVCMCVCIVSQNLQKSETWANLKFFFVKLIL